MRLSPLPFSFRIVLTTISLIILFFTPLAFAADTFTLSLTPSTAENRTGVGRVIYIDAEYSESNKQLSFEVQFEKYLGNIPDAFTLVVNSLGINPNGNDGEFAEIYFDARNLSNPKISIYAYNGLDPQLSHYDGTKLSGVQPADRILSSVSNPNFLLEASVSENPNERRTFRFRIDASEIQSHAPIYPSTKGNSWKGAEIGSKAGVWLYPVAGLYTEYRQDGFLSIWSPVVVGRFVATDLDSSVSSTQCPSGDDTDSDGDSVPDCLDACPLDAEKTESGFCGCGVTDIDSDSDGVLDCSDSCDLDPEKVLPGVCGCGSADTDANTNGIADCNELQCVGTCDSNNPSLDEDGDGVSNCQEIEDQSNPCDSGDLVETLNAFSCVGVNFFLNQINIATVRAQQETGTQKFTVSYRDASGALVSAVELELGTDAKRDIIVNDLGAQPDTIGTVCVEAEGSEWSGQVIIYKPRFNADGSVLIADDGGPVYDFALSYPFSNPLMGAQLASLNTNSLGTNSANSLVANWLRLTDAFPEDGKGIQGKIVYTDAAGAVIGMQGVSLTDGGRQDFAAHEVIGASVVAVAEFVPDDAECKFYLETTRYLYEGVITQRPNFVTAYNIPVSRPSGENLSGQLSTDANELVIAEILNAKATGVNGVFKASTKEGLFAIQETLPVPAKGTLHRILTGSSLASGTPAAAMLGPSMEESLTAISLIYGFDKDGALLYGFAPPFVGSTSDSQRVDFNTFLKQRNVLEVYNPTDKDIEIWVLVRGLNGEHLFAFDTTLKPLELLREELDDRLPRDTYGTVLVKSLGAPDLVVRSEIRRAGEYVLPFTGR